MLKVLGFKLLVGCIAAAGLVGAMRRITLPADTASIPGLLDRREVRARYYIAVIVLVALTSFGASFLLEDLTSINAKYWW